jgi:hypothetical protein
LEAERFIMVPSTGRRLELVAIAYLDSKAQEGTKWNGLRALAENGRWRDPFVNVAMARLIYKERAATGRERLGGLVHLPQAQRHDAGSVREAPSLHDGDGDERHHLGAHAGPLRAHRTPTTHQLGGNSLVEA